MQHETSCLNYLVYSVLLYGLYEIGAKTFKCSDIQNILHKDIWNDFLLYYMHCLSTFKMLQFFSPILHGAMSVAMTTSIQHQYRSF